MSGGFLSGGVFVLHPLKQLIKPPPESHQIERISQTKNRTLIL